MSNDFLVRVEGLFVIDDREFFADGGEELTFGSPDGGAVTMHAVGPRSAITGLARRIAAHHLASV
jgi:hypothetical protein